MKYAALLTWEHLSIGSDASEYETQFSAHRVRYQQIQHSRAFRNFDILWMFAGDSNARCYRIRIEADVQIGRREDIFVVL